MYNIVAVGDRKFTLGFQLAGIKGIVVDDNYKEIFTSLLQDKDLE